MELFDVPTLPYYYLAPVLDSTYKKTLARLGFLSEG